MPRLRQRAKGSIFQSRRGRDRPESVKTCYTACHSSRNFMGFTVHCHSHFAVWCHHHESSNWSNCSHEWWSQVCAHTGGSCRSGPPGQQSTAAEAHGRPGMGSPEIQGEWEPHVGTCGCSHPDSRQHHAVDTGRVSAAYEDAQLPEQGLCRLLCSGRPPAQAANRWEEDISMPDCKAHLPAVLGSASQAALHWTPALARRQAQRLKDAWNPFIGAPHL